MSKKDKSELISFDEYLSRVKADPSIVKNAHKRIYDAIMKKGYKIVKAKDNERLARALGLADDDEIVLYNLFADFHGIEKTLEKIVAYFRAASWEGELSKIILFLLGPPSSGKSSLARAIFSALQDEEVYYIEGCQIREEPLNLIPRSKRKQIEDELKVKISHNGDICPVCRKKLKEEFKGDYAKFMVKKSHISVRAFRFFASADATDQMSYDRAKYIGSVTLGEKEGDPSSLELDGAACNANRGGFEMPEIWKNPGEGLLFLLELTQSKTIESPGGRMEKIFIDVAIIGHSNKGEWEKFIFDIRNEPYLDRVLKINNPLNIRLDEQMVSFKKISVRNAYHVAPLALEALAAFTVLTRIKPSAKIRNLIDKMRIYNGEDLGADLPNVNELKNETPDDGMFGISNRDAAKIFELACANQPPAEHLCVDAKKIFKVAEEFIREILEASDEVKNTYLNVLDGVKNWCAKKLIEQFASFSDCFPEIRDEVFREYLEAVRKKTDEKELTQRELVLLDAIRVPDMSISEEDKLREVIIKKFKGSPASEITFAKTPEPLKLSIVRFVTSETIVKIIQTVVIEKESMNLTAAAMEKKERIFKKAKELGYCELCFKSVASWLIINKYI